MKNILIMNLTRMGDLLMTTPLIAGLKKKYPEVNITVLSNVKFCKVCEYIPSINKVLVFDVHQFDKTNTGESVSILEIYRYLEDTIEQLNSLHFDILINLTHSKLSAILSSHLDIPEVRGFTANEYGQRMILHPWIVYFCNMVNNRHYNMFHLVDIYLKSGDIKGTTQNLLMDIPSEAEKWADEYLQKEGVAEGELLIGFQPASSRPDRQWSTSNFAELGRLLINRFNARIIIFGVESEAELAKDISQLIKGGRVINAVAKTDIASLASLLKRCKTLVTNDTGTMHIASAVNTPIVALFFTHANVHETGPYGDGHLVLQSDIACSPCSHNTKCNNMICKDYITPADVAKTVEMQLFKNVQWDFHGVRVFFSSFDKNGMIEFNPVTKRKIRVVEIMAYAYRVLWQEALDRVSGLSKIPTSFIQEKSEQILRKIKSYYDTQNLSDLRNSINDSLAAFEQLNRRSSQAENIVENIQRELTLPEVNTLKIKALSGEIASIDLKIVRLSECHPELATVVRMFLFGKENQQGSDPYQLSVATLKLYRCLRDESEIMEGLVRGVTGEFL